MVDGDSTDKRQDTTSSDRPLRETLIVFLAVTFACAALWQAGRYVSFVRAGLPALIAAMFLYVPTWLLGRRGRSYEDFGLVWGNVPRGLLFYLGTSAVTFPLYTLGFLAYYRTTCSRARGAQWVPSVYRSMCRRFVGSWSRASLPLTWKTLESVAAQVIVVALPEEYFFRGYVQTQLHRALRPGSEQRWRVVVPVVATSVLFALGHVLVDFNPLRFAVFFPSLVFGWLRETTGCIVASVLFHASCNIVSDLLHRAFFSYAG